MRRRRLSVAALGATTLAIAACSAILDIDPDTFVTTTVDAAVTADASRDASADASSEAAADAASPCPNDATLCEDFDTDRDAGWSNQALLHGSLVVSDAASFSGAHSLLAETTRGSGDAFAFLVKTIGKETNVTIDFDVRPCDVTTGGAAFVVINDSQRSDSLSIGFGRDGNGVRVAVVNVAIGDAGASPDTTPYDFATDGFVHVRWTTVFAEGDDGSTTLQVGEEVLRAKKGIPTTSPNVTERVIQVGLLTSAPCSAYIDNVVIDAH